MLNLDKEDSSTLLPFKEFAHREDLLNWSMNDPEAWAKTMAAHQRVQREGIRGLELEELERELRSPRSS